MTRHLVLLGGSAEDACTYLQSFEDSGLTVEHRLEPDDLAQRSVDVLVTLDRRMIEWMADRSSRPTTIKSWVAIIEAGDRSAVKLARSAGVNGLILRGASPRQAKTQILRVRDQLQLSEQQERLKRRLSQGAGHTNRWVARSEAMRAAGAMFGRVAPFRIPLLIHGETGSGRSHLAQLIHESGPRSTGPMITLDCGSMDPARVGAKLFGKEPGAFANDEAESEGAISAAENGTLVLEDIAAMTEQVQTMLLEYLQTGTYRRVGAEQTDRADVRIIAIADKSLEERLHEKGFRLDLFQTLQGLRISLPPLRERREEIAPLLFHFLKQDADLCFPPITGISTNVLTQFMAHHWPRNVKELQEELRTACALAKGPILNFWGTGRHQSAQSADTRFASGMVDISQPLGTQTAEAVELVERSYLEHVLRRYRGQIAPSARHCGISRQLVSAKVKKYEIPLEQYRG